MPATLQPRAQHLGPHADPYQHPRFPRSPRSPPAPRRCRPLRTLPPPHPLLSGARPAPFPHRAVPHCLRTSPPSSPPSPAAPPASAPARRQGRARGRGGRRGRCRCRAGSERRRRRRRPPWAGPRRFQWPLLLLWAAAAGPGAGQEVQTENVTVAEGGVAEITCRLHQYDGSIVVIQNPARQTLFFNGTRALKDERFQLEEFSPRRVRIRLSDARLEDEGGYFCQLYTEDTHHQIATLTVLVAPENPVVEVREQAVEGGEVELSCLVPRSRPAATLRWYRDRKELKGVSSSQENGKVWSVASTVRFRVDRKDDGGIIICEAQNQALPSGHSKQTQYVLDVQYSPTARIHASQAVVREGDTLVLTCAVTGNPRPNQIRWNRGNESLPERAEAVGETLTLPGLVSADNGTYTCEASNKHGHARALYVLVVYDPGAVVEAQTSVPYAIVGGILALLVFLIICVLVGMVWCSVRQKGSYLTHEASGLDEQGEAREAFLNGSDGHKRKEEFFI
nr:cell adhesion molecule 4 [Macaca nemestrina]